VTIAVRSWTSVSTYAFSDLADRPASMPNTVPAVSAGSHAWRSPRRPSTTATSTSGTNTARIGVCRPTIEPSVSTVSRGSSLTPEVISARVTIGMARAPNATGAVLAISATVAALSGGKPSAMSITALMATGVPKPGG
jgi:hypothetical protein